MNVIDSIIENRNKLIEIAAAHGVIELKLYGSVLNRTEKPESDIDILAVFDPIIPYKWDATFELQEELEAMFNRRISILDSRRIPEVFYPQIDNGPVDIMTLEAGMQYRTTPKSSRIYYYMLDKLFRDYVYNIESTPYANTIYASLADRISWYFSRLLLLDDNDLRSYEGFDFTEVLYICDKIYDELFDQSPKDIARFKDLLPSIKEYVAARLPLYEK